MEIIRVIFLLKFVLRKRSSQNGCELVFSWKSGNTYCVTSSEGLRGIPELNATSRIIYYVYRSTTIYFYILQQGCIF